MKLRSIDINARRTSAPVSGRTRFLSILFVIITAVLVITVFSKTSFLYIFDDGPDITCLSEVGRRVIHGDVLYKDVLEQKGLYMILFFGLTTLISETSFVGVYLFELVLAALSLWIVKKCLDIYKVDPKIQMPLLIAAAVQFFGCTYNNHGGDVAEVLFLPVLLYVYYCGLRKIKQGISPDYYVIGILAALVFWSKYTLVATFVAWWIFEAVTAVKEKTVKALILNSCKIAAGVILASLPAVLYFAVNGALKDLFDVYFILNVTGYPSFSFSAKLLLFFRSFRYGITPVVVISAAYYALRCDKEKPKSTRVYNLIYLISLTVFLLYAGSQIAYYYAIYLVLIVPELMFFHTVIDTLKTEKGKRRAAIGFMTACLTLVVIYSNSFPYLLTQHAKPDSKWAEWNTRLAFED